MSLVRNIISVLQSRVYRDVSIWSDFIENRMEFIIKRSI